MLGRIFGVVYTMPYLALLITYPVGGVLLQALSPRVVFFIAGMGTCAVAPLLWLLLPRSRVD